MPDSFDLAALRNAAELGLIHWHLHTLERLLERGITRTEVLSAIMNGEMIESYTDDRPYPSCLILNAAPEPVHVVAAIDSAGGVCHIITVYRPDPGHFEPDWKTRRYP
jgi:hypothetical protein